MVKYLLAIILFFISFAVQADSGYITVTCRIVTGSDCTQIYQNTDELEVKRPGYKSVEIKNGEFALTMTEEEGEHLEEIRITIIRNNRVIFDEKVEWGRKNILDPICIRQKTFKRTFSFKFIEDCDNCCDIQVPIALRVSDSDQDSSFNWDYHSIYKDVCVDLYIREENLTSNYSLYFEITIPNSDNFLKRTNRKLSILVNADSVIQSKYLNISMRDLIFDENIREVEILRLLDKIKSDINFNSFTLQNIDEQIHRVNQYIFLHSYLLNHLQYKINDSEIPRTLSNLRFNACKATFGLINSEILQLQDKNEIKRIAQLFSYIIQIGSTCLPYPQTKFDEEGKKGIKEIETLYQNYNK